MLRLKTFKDNDINEIDLRLFTLVKVLGNVEQITINVFRKRDFK